MAKISSAFKCLICNQPLNFPNDTDITDFIILMLQFYKMHNLCENLSVKKDKVIQAAKRKVKG